MKRKISAIIIVALFCIGACLYFAGCFGFGESDSGSGVEQDTEQNDQPKRGYTVSVTTLKLAKNHNLDSDFDDSGMLYNSFRYYYEYEVNGNLEEEIYYDVNVQIAFYIGNEYVTTIENNFHIKGDGTASKKGYVYYYLDGYFKYSDILQLPIAQTGMTSKIVKVNWT